MNKFSLPSYKMFVSTKCELIKLPSSLQDHIDLFNQSTYLTYITFMSSTTSQKRECINTLPCGYKNNKKNRKSWKFRDESFVYLYISKITWNNVNNWLVVLCWYNRYDIQKNISFIILNFDMRLMIIYIFIFNIFYSTDIVTGTRQRT